ncbi:complex I subunit 5 family protein [Chakrabartyella piscis]|uniref:complex I subunit 5 family protein n=1 Tax=Chakrabartyella piscis TaxID=2918914 RepID=UPI002958574C|nr:proton-conducting transporter membrane subunit [Chakrabartyella piscis]
MVHYAIIIPILFPLIAGLILLRVKFPNRKTRECWIFGITLLNTLFALYAIFGVHPDVIKVFSFNENFSIAFEIDGLSMVFGTMVSLLWIPTVIYAFEYMTHEGNEDRFFAFFTMTYGVVLGIAFSGNFLTMYLFYELLTLATLPLVMHSMDSKARHAGKVYIFYMMFGAALAFVGFIFVYTFGDTLDFVYGGVLNLAELRHQEETLRMVFVVAFFGFGVKAAVFPFYRWLPQASVAPTPVTALLHAVAVVKSGVFAIIRLTFYSFGTELLIGTWAQYVVLAFVAFTIVFGSTVALRTPHIKRRFAYSTISNLSYILFGVMLMTPAGLAAALLHMIYHAVIKITLFFTAGSFLFNTHREYLYEIEGFGKLMPITSFALTFAGLSLVGIPPLAGFHSKWALATASVASGNVVSYIGIVALILSATLTALYVCYIVARLYFPRKIEYAPDYYHHVKEATPYMTIPLVVLCIVIFWVGLFPEHILEILQLVSTGQV